MARRKTNETDGHVSRLFNRFTSAFELIRNPWFMVPLLILLGVGAMIYAWRGFRPEILSNAQYDVSAETMQIPAQPDWIRSDIKDEVVRDSSLDRLKLYDNELLTKIHDAFAVHPWVAQVRAVEKRLGRIVVQLGYRRPVAMVEYTARNSSAALPHREGLVPVDAQGVRLPTTDFLPEGVQSADQLHVADDSAIDDHQRTKYADRIRNFLRISVSELSPPSVEGTLWGDDRLHHAAQLAAAWQDEWKEAGLYRIVVITREVGIWQQTEHEIELQTSSGTRVRWGQTGSDQDEQSSPMDAKIAAIMDYVNNHGPLNEIEPPLELDVRSGKVISTPRTANRPSP